MTARLPIRAVTGFVAAAMAVVIFHQGMIFVLRETHSLGIGAGALVWNMKPNPFGVPQLLNLCFWGGLYGAAFGMLAPRIRIPMWVAGFLMGCVAAMVGYFVVAPIKGLPVGGGWVAMNWVRSIAINGSFGLGLGLIYPRLAAALR